LGAAIYDPSSPRELEEMDAVLVEMLREWAG